MVRVEVGVSDVVGGVVHGGGGDESRDVGASESWER